MSFFSLEILKEKPTKFIGIMSHLKLSKNYVSKTKKIEKQTKIAIHMDL
jgi:RNase P subunit RPR2